METTYTKQDDTTLLVTKPIEAVPTTEVTYKLDELKNQEIAILKSKNDFAQARDAELEEVRNLISQAEALGIKTQSEVDLSIETARDAEMTPQEVSQIIK